MTPETELLIRLKSGDRDAFAELVNLHSARIYNLALRMTSNPTEAEEVLQETFIQAARHIGSFRGQSKLGTWLHRIATNQALMRLRQKQPISVSIEEQADETAESFQPLADLSDLPEDELLTGEALGKINEAIDKLPQNLRVVFVLRDLEGLSTAETADSLGLSISAVKSRLLRARLKLRESLSDYFDERIGARRA